jgi:glyoxylase-like metal-dependent hydrolase (beta-lactamase superfamily II)
VLGDVVVHELQVADPDLVYVNDDDPELSAATRKRVLGRLADEGTDVIVSHFHGPGRFSRRGEGFSWSSLAKEGEAAVE